MDRPEFRHRRVVAGDGPELHIAEAGSGTPVVLLHGFPENWRCWRHQFRPLIDAGYSVVAADLRGYGESGRPPGRRAYRLDALVGDVAAIVRAAGGRAHVVGHDWGGVIAWHFAAAFPDLLDKLVILNAPHPAIYRRVVWRSSQLFKSWYIAFFLVPGLPERVLAARDFRAIREAFRRSPARPGTFDEEQIDESVAALRPPGALSAALNYYRANMPSVATGATRDPRTDAETLVIWGERDTALSIRLLEGLSDYAPRLEVVRIADAGHWVQNEAPAEVNETLIRFLSRN